MTKSIHEYMKEMSLALMERQALAVDFVNRLPHLDDDAAKDKGRYSMPPLVEWSQPQDPLSFDEDALLRQWETERPRMTVQVLLCEWQDLLKRAEPLSSSWHHLPCVTAGLPDPRPVHPVAAAIGRQARAVAPGLVIPNM